MNASSETIITCQRKRQQCARDLGDNLPPLGARVAPSRGPSWASLARLGAHLLRRWPLLGPVFGNLGIPLKQSWTHLRSILSYLALFGCLLTQNATMCERSWRLLGPSWGPSSAILGPVLGKPGPYGRPPLAKVAPVGARLRQSWPPSSALLDPSSIHRDFSGPLWMPSQRKL